MKFAYITSATAVAYLLLLPACVPQYKQTKLIALNTQIADYQETKNSIFLKARILIPKESQTIFGHRGKYLHTAGIIPVQLSVTNNTVEELTLNPINAPLANSYKVISTLKTNKRTTVGALLALGGVFTLFTGVGGFVAVGMYALTGQALYLLGLLPMTGVIISTSTGAMYVHKQVESANQAIVEDIHSLSSVATIAPGTTLDTVLFLDKANYNQAFSVSLKGALIDTTFTVNLHK